MLKIIRKNFEKELEKIKSESNQLLGKEEASVRQIIKEVQKYGDKAISKFTFKFDGIKIAPANFEVKKEDWQKAVKKVPQKIKEAILKVSKNIEKFHKQDIPRSWLIKKEGKILGKRVSPIEKVGLYVPGGKAEYFSTVLMLGIPAKIAGVKEIIMVTPPGKNGKISDLMLFSAKVAGIHRIFKIGGVQAIAGLAFGTKYFPKVDKIFGPGNVYVSLAKKLLFGQVGIDSFAGPSELLILAEKEANPNYVAVDLMAQAEHDSNARVWLLTDSEELINQVNKKIKKIIELSPRKKIIKEALKNARAFLFKKLEEAFSLINQIAPEHLQIMVNRPDRALNQIKNAGAIFIGPFTPTSAGDYSAGPNHTLPTGGTAKFSSGLNVSDFMKNSSVIYYSQQAIKKEAEIIEKLATLEGLDVHALSAIVRKIL